MSYTMVVIFVIQVVATDTTNKQTDRKAVREKDRPTQTDRERDTKQDSSTELFHAERHQQQHITNHEENTKTRITKLLPWSSSFLHQG